MHKNIFNFIRTEKINVKQQSGSKQKVWIRVLIFLFLILLNKSR